MRAPHYENRCLYLEDAAETDKPWEQWEVYAPGIGVWLPLKEEPMWIEQCKYRRIDPYREYKEAVAKGKTIQLLRTQTWSDLHCEPSWTQPPECYQVKPES